MARKTKIITIETGADAGKTFEITMPDAFRGEDLFMRIMSLCAGTKNNNSLLQKLMATDEGRSILNSMLDFIKIVMPIATRKIDKEDIELPQTLLRLRTEALGMLMDFITE